MINASKRSQLVLADRRKPRDTRREAGPGIILPREQPRQAAHSTNMDRWDRGLSDALGDLAAFLRHEAEQCLILAHSSDYKALSDELIMIAAALHERASEIEAKHPHAP